MTSALALRDDAIDAARLPQVYVAARAALESCSRIDECQDWADKAEALASYARQSHDDTLRQLADRIQARAIRRAGQLLQEIAPAMGARTDRPRDGAVPRSPTRTEAATAAGLSDRQRKTALRVAAVPADEFEAALEADNPPTVTQLARRGTNPAPRPAATAPWMQEMADDQRRPGFQEATAFIGTLSRLVERCEQDPPALVRSGMSPAERQETLANWTTLKAWFQAFTEANADV